MGAHLRLCLVFAHLGRDRSLHVVPAVRAGRVAALSVEVCCLVNWGWEFSEGDRANGWREPGHRLAEGGSDIGMVVCWQG